MERARLMGLRRQHWMEMDAWVLACKPFQGDFDFVVVKQYSGEVYLVQLGMVDTLKEAERMIQKFKADPPYGKNVKQRYTQMLEVWVKEEKQVVGGWV